MEVKIVKLVTGDMIICEVEDSGSKILLKDTYILAPTEQGMGIIPYSKVNAIKNNSISVLQEHIIFIEDAMDEIVDCYKNVTGKGIVTPGGLVT